MRWLRPLFCTLIAGLSVCTAIAADQSQPGTLELNNGLLASSGEQSQLFKSVPDNSFFVKGKPLYGAVQLSPNGDVCYTMRSYKVKPREHFAEGESGRAGYSTCERASAFHFRSADDDAPTKLK